MTQTLLLTNPGYVALHPLVPQLDGVIPQAHIGPTKHLALFNIFIIFKLIIYFIK